MTKKTKNQNKMKMIVVNIYTESFSMKGEREKIKSNQTRETNKVSDFSSFLSSFGRFFSLSCVVVSFHGYLLQRENHSVHIYYGVCVFFIKKNLHKIALPHTYKNNRRRFSGYIIQCNCSSNLVFWLLFQFIRLNLYVYSFTCSLCLL